MKVPSVRRRLSSCLLQADEVATQLDDLLVIVLSSSFMVLPMLWLSFVFLCHPASSFVMFYCRSSSFVIKQYCSSSFVVCSSFFCRLSFVRCSFAAHHLSFVVPCASFVICQLSLGGELVGRWVGQSARCSIIRLVGHLMLLLLSSSSSSSSSSCDQLHYCNFTFPLSSTCDLPLNHITCGQFRT